MVMQARTIMQQEFAVLGGVAEVAERLHISQHHLSRLFVSQTGTTPIAFLTKIRLQNAVKLLTQTNLSIEEVARQSGFSCGNYFCKTFSRHMGLSPLQYRRSMKSISYDRITI